MVKSNAVPSLIMYERPFKCSFVSGSVFNVNKGKRQKWFIFLNMAAVAPTFDD